MALKNPIEGCETCQDLDANLDQTCSRNIALEYKGLYTDTEQIRALIGVPGDDPTDPSGFITDTVLGGVVNRAKATIFELAERRMAEQCLALENKLDASTALLLGAQALQNTQREARLQELRSQLGGVSERQQSAQRAFLQDLRSKLEGVLSTQTTLRQRILQDLVSKIDGVGQSQATLREQTIQKLQAAVSGALAAQNTLRQTRFQTFESAIDGLRARQKSLRDTVIQDLSSRLDAVIANQDSARQKTLQAIRGDLAAAKSALEIEVRRLVEEFTQRGLPSDASEYIDETEVNLLVSPTAPGLSYGVIDEPYILARFEGTERVTATVDGAIKSYTTDPDIFRTAQTSFFPVYRTQVKGRFIYLTNNKVDIQSATVWLTTSERVEEYARAAAEGNAKVDELQVRLDNYLDAPTTDFDGEAADLTRRLAEYQANPTTDVDGELADTIRKLQEYTADPVTESDGDLESAQRALTEYTADPVTDVDGELADLTKRLAEYTGDPVTEADSEISDITKRIAEFTAEPFTEVDGEVESVTKQLAEYAANPVTEADTEVGRISEEVYLLCTDPKLLSPDELIADAIDQYNQVILSEARAAVETSAATTAAQRSDSDIA